MVKFISVAIRIEMRPELRSERPAVIFTRKRETEGLGKVGAFGVEEKRRRRVGRRWRGRRKVLGGGKVKVSLL